MENGVRYTGATSCLITDMPEDCLIILQKPVEVLPSDDPVSLQRRVMETAEWDVLTKAVSLFCEGRLKVEGKRIVIAD